MKIDKKNGTVCFNEESHIYWDETNENDKYTSVTTLIHKFTQPFDKDFWSGYKALEKLIPKEIPREIYKMNLDEFLFEYKVITDNIFEDKKIMRIKSENLGIISFNVEYLYDALKILKIDSDFELELYGELKPIIIHNDEGEMGLILPIKTY